VILRALIFILSLAGFLDSLYFNFAYYGRVKKARWVPEALCAREGSNCVTVVRTRYGSLLGVPNSLLGGVYYLALILWAGAAPSASASLLRAGVIHFLNWLLVVVAAATVAMGFYLVYALRRILRTDCPLCYIAHAINAALLVLLVEAAL
jgi:uncharacterized membrane protein